MTGTIKRLVMDRGYGFIAAEDTKEFFFHSSGVVGVFEDLREGDAVRFDIEPSQKGPRAHNVQAAAAAVTTNEEKSNG